MIEAIFHGHSFLEISSAGMGSIFVDPFISDNPTCDITLEQAIERNPLAIVVTHGHGDHIGNTIEIAKKTGCLVIATYELAHRFVSQGIEHVSKQHIGGEVKYEVRGKKEMTLDEDDCASGSYSVKFVPAVHGGWIEGSSITGLASGVIIRIDGKHIYHAGDTALTQEMKLLGAYETIDVAFLPIGDRFTMGVKDAVIATEFIKPKIVVPIHYNTRPLIKADPIAFAREIMLQNLATPKVLQPGQAILLKEKTENIKTLKDGKIEN